MTGNEYTADDVEQMLIEHAGQLWPDDWRDSLTDVDVDEVTVIDIRGADRQHRASDDPQQQEAGRAGWLAAVACLAIALLALGLSTDKLAEFATTVLRTEPVGVEITDGPWISVWTPTNFEMSVTTNEACSVMTWSINNLETGQTVMGGSDDEAQCSSEPRIVDETRSEAVFESGRLYQILTTVEGAAGDGPSGAGTAEGSDMMTYSEFYNFEGS